MLAAGTGFLSPRSVVDAVLKVPVASVTVSCTKYLRGSAKKVDGGAWNGLGNASV